MSQILDVPISYFFDDMSETTMQSSPRRVARGLDHGNEADDGVKDPMARRETLELVRTYYTIEDASLRKRVAEMVKAVAATLSEGKRRRRRPRRNVAGPWETGT